MSYLSTPDDLLHHRMHTMHARCCVWQVHRAHAFVESMPPCRMSEGQQVWVGGEVWCGAAGRRRR